MKKSIFLLGFISIVFASTLGAVNRSYYSSLDGKKDDALRAALTELLYTKHTIFVKYNWDFPYDYDSDGNMLDIYSSCGYNSHNTYPTSYKCCCDAINREHVVCQSNFGGSDSKDKIPQYSDRHHLYPVDGRANGHRSDLPFGECSKGNHGSCSSASTTYPSEGTSTCANHEYGKSGSSTFSVALPSGGGSVYEVGDEYKGDIARAILYMVVRYADEAHCRLPDGAKNASTSLKTANDYPVTAWANTTKDKVGQMFSNSLSPNHGLSNYGKALLLKWHRQDPVSQKEIDRNNGVEAVQGNRNPFVDFPCLVEYLWGDLVGTELTLSGIVGSFEEGFSGEGCSNTAAPSIVRPTDAIDMGATNTGVAITKSVTIQGANLTSGLTLSVTGTNASYFTLSQTSMTKSVATSGKAITITYLPTAAGDHTATLRISGGGLDGNYDVALSGSCCDQYTISLWRNGAVENLTCCGSYTLPTGSTEDDACEGWTFRGWATATVSGTTTKPSFITSVSSAQTLYAVYGKTEGSGGSDTEYTLFTDSLEDGDYIIYYSNKAMKAKVENSRLQYNVVTPSNDKITTTEDSIVWHIALSGGYWTIYNAKTQKYAASTGADNKAQLLADVADDKTKWTTSGHAVHNFVNKANKAGDKNAYLRNNGSYGFACYSTSTGGALSLYKRGTATTTYKSVPCPAYTISLADEDGIAEGGQYTASATSAIAGTVITLEAEPDDGYVFDGWTVNKAGDPSTEVAVYFDAFPMPEYDVEVHASFSVKPTYTAVWLVNGNRHAQQTGLYFGETPVLPDEPEDCSEDRVFMGWTTQAEYEHATTAPSDLFSLTAPAISQDTTFYAVFADKSTTSGPGTTAYNRINSTSDLSNGEYLIVYEKGALIFNGGLATLDVASNTIGVTINNHSIATATKVDTATFTITAVTGGYTIQSHSGLYIGQSSNSNGLGTNQSSSTYTDTITFVGDSVDIRCKSAHLRYNKTSGQTRFRYYKSSTYTSQETIQLYKKVTTQGDPITTYINYSLYCSQATHTLTFIANGKSYATRSGHMGETVEAVAEPTGCNDYTFMGWSTHEYATGNTGTPTLDYTGRVPGADKTYYAVYSHSTGGGSGMSDNYKRITNRADLTTGNYVLAGYNNGYFALSTQPKSTYYLDGISVTPTQDEIIAEPDATITWHITVNGDLAKIEHATAGYLYVEQNGKYYNIKLGNNTIDHSFTFGVSDGSWTFTSVTYSTQVLEYYITSSRWAFYKEPDAPIYLYKQQPNESATITYTTAPACSETPTDVQRTDVQCTKVEKRIEDGRLMIWRNGHIYNAQGARVK